MYRSSALAASATFTPCAGRPQCMSWSTTPAPMPMTSTMMSCGRRCIGVSRYSARTMPAVCTVSFFDHARIGASRWFVCRFASAHESSPNLATSRPHTMRPGTSLTSRPMAARTSFGMMITSSTDAWNASSGVFGYSCWNRSSDPSSAIFSRRHASCSSVSPNVSATSASSGVAANPSTLSRRYSSCQNHGTNTHSKSPAKRWPDTHCWWK